MKSNIINNSPLVCVRCMTFNHEAYIEDALNGFVMQQTNFPFVVAIVDDASTDNTKSVINDFVKNNCIYNHEIDLRTEDYGTVLDVTVKDNPHCIFHIVHLNENHYGKKSKLPYFAKYENAAKYVAMCEGDDYWTDPLKLQKQVDFMEANIEYSICFHKVNTLIQETGEMKEEFVVRDMPGKSTILDLAVGNYIHWPTVLIRYDKNIQDKYSTMGACLPGDYVLLMLYAEKGDIYKFNEPMAVYRYGSGVWSTSQTINNDLKYLNTLNKLYVTSNNEQARNNIQKQIKNITESIVQIERDLNQIRSSKAYRLGKILLRPFKWLRK